MTRKTNTVLIGLLGTILMGLSTWVLITLIDVKSNVDTIKGELTGVEKNINRIYGYVNSKK